MIDSMSSADVANAERFVRAGIPADAITASQTRDEFARWIGDFFDLDLDRTNDLVLAINEALANSAEHAYPSADSSGTTDVYATYDAVSATMTVTVADRGEWRAPSKTPESRYRGRGIPLMSALADHADIESSDDGTLVSLVWAGVRRR